MAETLYPKRKRCKTCGRAFPERGAILGLYDTYKCAGMAEPFKNVKDAPKWCTTDRGGKLQWKKRMRHEGELPVALRNDPSASFYYCSHCGFGHVGHSRVKLEVEDTVKLSSLEDLARVLRKHRESKGWTLKEAGVKTGLRPIRIRELEDADQGVTMDNALRALRGYGLGLAVVFKP